MTDKMTKEELIQRRKILIQERTELQHKLDDPVAEARTVFDLIFKEKFKAGGKWIERVKVKGRRDKLAVSFLGSVRHLYGYLHTDQSMHAAMDRRGVNSIVQGPASNIGFLSIYLFKKLTWDLFESRGVNLGIKLCNAIHDAQIDECRYVNIPLAIYMLEHSMTTLCHKFLRDEIGFEVNMSFETDCGVGPSLAEINDATRWNDQIDAIRKGLEWKRDKLGLQQPIEEIMKVVESNAKIIFELRRKEIQHQLKNEIRVSYDTDLNYDNALKLGLVFDNPEEVVAVKSKKSWLDE